VHEFPLHANCIYKEQQIYDPKENSGGSSGVKVEGYTPPQCGHDGYYQENVAVITQITVHPQMGTHLADSVIEDEGQTHAD